MAVSNAAAVSPQAAVDRELALENVGARRHEGIDKTPGAPAGAMIEGDEIIATDEASSQVAEMPDDAFVEPAASDDLLANAGQSIGIFLATTVVSSAVGGALGLMRGKGLGGAAAGAILGAALGGILGIAGIAAAKMAPKAERDASQDAIHITQVRNKRYNPNGRPRSNLCGVTSAVMALRFAGLEVKGLPENLRGKKNQRVLDHARSIATSNSLAKRGTFPDENLRLLKSGGGDLHRINVTGPKAFRTMLEWARDGRPVFLGGSPVNAWTYRNGYRHKTGHAIVLSGYDKQTDRYIINDPLSHAGPQFVTSEQLYSFMTDWYYKDGNGQRRHMPGYAIRVDGPKRTGDHAPPPKGADEQPKLPEAPVVPREDRTPDSGPEAYVYTVEAGDTLWAIEQAGGPPIEAIVAANQIDDATLIKVGDPLVLPGMTPEEGRGLERALERGGAADPAPAETTPTPRSEPTDDAPDATPSAAAEAPVTAPEPDAAGARPHSALESAAIVGALARKADLGPDAARTAVAIMLVESGGNNRWTSDDGRWVGLFGLDAAAAAKDGLGGTEVFEPQRNARYALDLLRAQVKRNPEASLLENAAVSQNARNPAAYVRKVEAELATAEAMLEMAG